MTRPSMLQVATAVAFVVMIIANAASASLSDKLGLQSNQQLTEKRRTAFTPAGWAFSIWSVIYTLGALTIVWSTLPSKRDWVPNNVRVALIVNFLANTVWLPLFQGEVGDLWVSVVVIISVLVPTLAYVHLKLGVGDGCGGYLSAPVSKASLLEVFVTHSFISIYLGWTCVATIANISLALTPSGTVSQLGWGASAWSITMQTVAACLAIVMIVLRGDAAFVAPIAWALLAIGDRQRDPVWPGTSDVVKTAFALSGILWLAIAVVVVLRTARYATRSKVRDGSPLLQEL